MALRWFIVAPGSALMGYLLDRLHVPAAWILGAILVSGAVALTTGEELSVNKHVYTFGRGIVGILAALPLVGVPVLSLVRVVPAGLFATAITVGIGVLGGLLLARSQASISRESGVLSMLAGGASVMPAIASDVGADVRYVALAQYLRLLAVSLSLPLVAHLLMDPAGAGNSQMSHPVQHHWFMVPVVLAIASGGGYVARSLRMPVPSVFGPLVLTVLVSLLLPSSLNLVPPMVLRVLALMSIGWVCGGSLSLRALKEYADNLLTTVIFIVVIIAACAASAWPLTHWLSISYFEAYLATSPGALETVLALGAEGGAGHEVVAVQLIRLVSVLLLAGYLKPLLKRLG
ncbi:AbrB family transcriptional regulator [Corynebacterium tapiri]|uniref:AbrB family transcriptional regulator n=1 Tax=Corynebacterium tapiri TaxID=1448266 RepID=A0A5C4U2S2_9CORY|nr:AbrB family transcriptional regulator [Corynebacterium tapiri]TNL96788.1 AbrB family transcriptional regulator [Corynebacterium tapiri]